MQALSFATALTARIGPATVLITGMLGLIVSAGLLQSFDRSLSVRARDRPPDFERQLGHRTLASSASIQTRAPQLNGLSGEYTTRHGPSMSTACPRSRTRPRMTVSGGLRSPVFLLRRITSWLTWTRTICLAPSCGRRRHLERPGCECDRGGCRLSFVLRTCAATAQRAPAIERLISSAPMLGLAPLTERG